MSPRVRVAVELGSLALATTVFLCVFPERPVTVDAGLALLALGYVLGSRRFTRERVWGPPPDDLGRRRRRSWRWAAGVTAVPVAVFLGGGVVLARQAGQAIGERILQPGLVVALACYLPWALAQQTLFQFYLLGRLRVLVRAAPAPALCLANGAAYSLVHLPDVGITAVTALAGTAWSALYLRDRLLLPLAVSHAVLGATFYYWVYGRDLTEAWLLR